MTELGVFTIDTAETFNETRRKIVKLARAFGFDDIAATRIATGFSEIARPKPGRPAARVSAALGRNGRGKALALRFELSGGKDPFFAARRLFDSFEPAPAGNGHTGALALKFLPDPDFHATPAFLDEQREMLARPSREELMLALKRQNDALAGEIAERRQTEERLRRSEARIQGIVEAIPDSLVMVDQAGLITFINSQAERTFGYTRQELLGQPIAMLMPEEDKDGHEGRMALFFREGRVRALGIDLDIRAMRKDGTAVPVDIKLSPLVTETGMQAIASIRDVTDQKKALESVKQLSQVVEQSPSSVVITDREGRIQYVNPAFTSTTGYSQAEAIGQNPSLLKSGKTPPEVFTDLWDTITSGRIWRGQIINRKKNGEIFWESTAIAPIVNLQNEITHFAAVKEDITERIRGEEELKRQRALLDTLINALPMVIYAKDAVGTYQVVNDSLCAMTGKQREEIVGRNAFDLFPKETAEHIHAVDQNTTAGLSLVTEEDWRTYPDGRRALFHMTRVPIMDEEGKATGLVGAFLDITERKEAEDAVRAAQAEMTQIFNTAAGGMRVIDRDFTVRKVNDAFLELTGYTREEMVGHKCHEYFGGGDCHTEDCPLSRILEGEERVEFLALKEHKDGTPIYCEVTVTRQVSPDGELVGIIEDFRDVTERMKAQHLIKQSEIKYRELVETSRSIILKLDMEGRITFFNEFSQQFFGFSADEAVGRPITDTIVPKLESGGRDMVELIREITLDPERYAKNENENVCKDGSRVWVSWTNQVVRDDITGKAKELLCIGLDATERKKAQDALHDAMDVISGSIRYASRIQRAVLPPSEDFARIFSNHFIIWNPRDVVGGDIYWSARWGKGSLFVLGDCTGHGVPGAFMTLISTGALSRALTEVEPGHPGLLMSRAHQIVQLNLNQHTEGGESDDGMELGMCYVEPGAQNMLYVGARFPLFIDAGGEIAEIKPDRKGIGYRAIPHGQEFAEQSIALTPGMRMYMVSDGVFDQVGGEKRRGFGKNRFKELLESLREVPFEFHGERIYQALVDYQGDESRRDDVSIMGLEY